MDHNQFDAITRRLVAGPTRRTLFRWLARGALGGWLVVGDGAPRAHAREGRVTICHFPPGRARPGVVMTVPRNSLRAHLQHGDFRITGKPGRTRSACRSTCKGGTPTCGGACCGPQRCVLRDPAGTARVCCPAHREFVECSLIFTCLPDEETCCVTGDVPTFCCPETQLCGFTCCFDGEQCLDPEQGLCTCPPAQRCGAGGAVCCAGGLTCNQATGSCQAGIGYARLRRP